MIYIQTITKLLVKRKILANFRLLLQRKKEKRREGEKE